MEFKMARCSPSVNNQIACTKYFSTPPPPSLLSATHCFLLLPLPAAATPKAPFSLLRQLIKQSAALTLSLKERIERKCKPKEEGRNSPKEEEPLTHSIEHLTSAGNFRQGKCISRYHAKMQTFREGIQCQESLASIWLI